MADRLAENLARVRETIAETAARSGRAADSVTLVAVTKYASDDVTRRLVELGCVEMGESRPQQLWRKMAKLADPALRWHLIGHLQRNKVERTVPIALVQSIDSPRLLAAVDAEASRLKVIQPVLLEVNISRDPAKHGFNAEEVPAFVESLSTYRHVDVRGLMAMAGTADDRDAARRDFANLRQLRDQLRRNSPPQLSWNELSMGMSGDFDVAIEEGATIVRVGSALFEGLTE